MFALIFALGINPVNGHTIWEVYQEGFTSYQDCISYTEDHQKEMANYATGYFICDELKEAR